MTPPAWPPPHLDAPRISGWPPGCNGRLIDAAGTPLVFHTVLKPCPVHD